MIARSAVVRRGFGVALAAVLVTSGCAAGRDAQTANQVATQDGTDATLGPIALRGLALEAPTGDFYSAGQAIPVRLVLINNGDRDDQLVNIVTSDARGWASFATEAQAAQVVNSAATRRQPGSSGPSASTTGGASSASAATSGSPSTDASSTESSSTESPSTDTPSSDTPSTDTPSTDASGAPSTGSGTSSTSADSSSPAGSTSASSTQASLPRGSTSVTIPTGRRVSWGVPDSDRGLLLLSATGRVYPGTSVKLTFTFARAGSVTVTVPVQLSSQPGDLTVAPESSESAD